MTAKSVVDVILGEAKAGSFEDMLAIASVIQNRAKKLGVTPEQVVSVRSEFNAYGKPLPKGTDSYRELAQQALEQVRTNGPVHDATFYATPSASDNLPSGLSKVTSTDGHVYYSDPKNRSIRTSAGFKKPEPYTALSFAPTGPMPPERTPQNGQDAIDAMLSPPNLRSRASAVADNNQQPLAPMPSLDLAFDYPAQSEPSRVRKGFEYGLENYDINQMDQDTAYAARRAFDQVGVDPTINSTFRSGVVPAGAKRGTFDYNKAVGGAKHSQHKEGKALDIRTRGMTNDQIAAMVDALMSEGLGGIGVGANIIHADSGAPRSWTYGNSVPSEVRSVMEARYEGNRLNRYPSDFGNIPSPTSKPKPQTEIATGSGFRPDLKGAPIPVTTPEPIDIPMAIRPNLASGGDLLSLSDNFSKPDIPSPSRYSRVQDGQITAPSSNSMSLSPVTHESTVTPRSAAMTPAPVSPTSISPVQQSMPTIHAREVDRLVQQSPISTPARIKPDHVTPVSGRTTLEPTTSRSATPTKEAVKSAYQQYAQSRMSAPAPKPASVNQEVISAGVPSPKAPAPTIPSTPTLATPSPAVPTPAASTLPMIDAPTVAGVGLPQTKPEVEKKPNKMGKFAGRLLGGVAGGALLGPLGLLAGGYVGGKIGEKGLPKIGNISLGPIISKEGFGRTPTGQAVNAATRNGGFNNYTYTKTYANSGGSSDGKSYGKALANEQRERAAAGQKTIADAFGGLF